MTHSYRVYFIILTFYPSLNLLRKNLGLLAKQDVVVVDNTPEAEQKEAIRKAVGNTVGFIGNEKNLGYSGGMNIGMKHAWNEGADWVVLLNDDVELSKEAVTTLVDTLEKEHPAVIGPYPGYLDRKRWTTILPSNVERPPAGEAGRTSKENKVDYLSGSCLAIHKDVDNHVQGFYKDFFLYYEDVDYCIQAKKFGFPLIPIELPGIVHQDGKSIEKGSETHSYYLARNHLLFVERQAPMFIKLREFIRLPKTLWECWFYVDKASMKGVIDFLFLRYGELKR